MIRDKKGSISIFVLVALLFMTGFLVISFANNLNKSKTVKEQFDIVSETYKYTEQGIEDGLVTKISAKVKPLNYGDYVDYKVDLDGDKSNTTDWKIFYNDGTNVFIIASKCIESSKLPETLRMTRNNLQYPYKANWESEDSYLSTGANEISESVANKYNLTWIKDNATSIANNAKATADLLNTDVWTKSFGNAIEGAEAIGTPTLEMWVKSWNEKSTIKIYTEYDKTGYKVGTVKGSLGTTTSGLKNDANLYKEGSVYFPKTASENNNSGYWLASPSSYNENTLISVLYETGELTGINSCINTLYGVRPVVCLPADTIGTQTETGTWTISK